MATTSLLQENIASMLNLEPLPDEQKLALLDKMSSLVQKRIALRVFDRLTAEEQDVFMAATAAGDEKRVAGLLSEKGVDIAALIENEVLKLKEEMKEVAGTAGVLLFIFYCVCQSTTTYSGIPRPGGSFATAPQRDRNRIAGHPE